MYFFSDDPKIRLTRELGQEQEYVDDSKDSERYIETLVVVDEKMCAFHGEDAAKQFTLAACNIVSETVILLNGPKSYLCMFIYRQTSRHLYNDPGFEIRFNISTK